MELAGAQINANDREQRGGKRKGEGGCAFRQRLCHHGECPVSLFGDQQPRGPPGGPGAHLPCSPLPSPSPGVSPAFCPGGGGRRWHRLLRRGTKVPTAACGRKCPALGKGGRGFSVEGGPEPRASPPAHPPQGCAAPPPPPPAPQAPAQGPEVRGRPPLVVCLEGKEGRRGEKPKVGLAEGLTGNSTTLA